MFVKCLRSILVMMILLVLLVACGQAAPPAAPAEEPAAEAPAAEATEQPAEEAVAEQPEEAIEPGTLRVWMTWGDNPAQVQELFNKYTKAAGVKVEVNAPVDESKVIAALSGSEPPDILVLGSPDNVSAWVNEGLILPLDDMIAANKIDTADIYPAMLAQGERQGKLYSLPWGTDTYGLYWNKDLFEEAGLDPEKPPQTLEEMAEYADKLTKTDDNGEITQLGFVPDFSWSHIEQYAAMFGGYWVNEDGTKIQLSSPAMVDALKWEQQFYTKYDPEKVLKFTSSFGEYSSAEHGFMAGKVAMMVDGEWMTGPNFIQGLKPDLWYGVAPLPYPKDRPEQAGVNVVGGTMVVVPSGIKDQAAAGKLLAWMMSPEIIAEEMVANFNLPSSKKSAEDPRFRENESFAVFLDTAAGANTKHQIYTPASTEIFTEIELIEEQVLHAGADPEPLLKEAEAKLQPALDKALAK